MNIRFADTPSSAPASRQNLKHRATAHPAPITGFDPLTPGRFASHLLHCGKMPLPVVARKVPAVHKILADPRMNAEQLMDDAQFLRDDVDDTLTHYLAAIAFDSNQTNAARHLGHVLLNHDELDAARICFDYTQQITPNDPLLSHAYLNLGEAYKEGSRPEQAALAYRQALRLDPKQMDALENLGLTYMDLNRNFLAILTFSDYLVSTKNSVSVWCNLGICWRNIGCLEAAMSCYRQALQLDSKLTAARFNLCLIYLRLQMFGPLIGEYLTLRHQDPALAMQLEPLIVSK